jgi:exodeoxyribonuclease X
MLKGYVAPAESLCTLALARQYITGTTNHKLETLKNELGFPDQKSHSALGDVYTTLDLLRYLVPKSGTTLETLFKRANLPKIVHKMPFGKHKGVLMTKVPPDYRTWLLAQDNLDKDLRYTLEKLK